MTDILEGKSLVADQIYQDILYAGMAVLQLQEAMFDRDVARIQEAAAKVHGCAQTAQLLAWKLQKDIGEYRNRQVRVR